MMKGGNMAANKAQSLGLSETISEEHVEEIINSKDYILKCLGNQFMRLEQSCDRKWELAQMAEEDGSVDLNINRKTKKENTDLKEYNQQVKALADIGIKLVQIQKSDFKTVEEEQATEDDDDEELV